MGKYSVKIEGVEELMAKVEKGCRLGVQTGLSDTMNDLGRVASGFAPRDTGHLEQSYKSEVTQSGKKWTGSVTFRVTANKYNYAIIMHEGFYNLGVGSQGKSGGSSKFGSVSHSVGRKYLEAPFIQLAPNYCEHIAQRIRELILQ